MSRSSLILSAGVLMIVGLVAPDTPAQCILANPSFEIPGSGGQVLGGWNHFGWVGSSIDATHGSIAARVASSYMYIWLAHTAAICVGSRP